MRENAIWRAGPAFLAPVSRLPRPCRCIFREQGGEFDLLSFISDSAVAPQSLSCARSHEPKVRHTIISSTP